jgi:hypothetical protein
MSNDVAVKRIFTIGIKYEHQGMSKQKINYCLIIIKLNYGRIKR